MKAIVSDIHANVAAWEAVKKDIKSHGISDIISLGDLVGYGPEPVDIIDAAMDFRINLMGNHDEAVIFEPVGFNYRALTAIRWTKRSLQGGMFGFRNKKRMSFLKGLKLTHREDPRAGKSANTGGGGVAEGLSSAKALVREQSLSCHTAAALVVMHAWA
jgi:hypothetical protein